MSILQLYYDDTSSNIQYSPQSAWASNESSVWTGGRSQAVIQFPGADLTFTFNGTAALFYGAALNGSTFIPVIDDLPQARYTLPSSDPPTYGVWYRTPDLQPGTHTIVFNDLPELTLDYIIVEVDPRTVFHGVSALISDSDPGIHYTGSWQKATSRFETLRPFEFIGDYSTESSCNPGDTLSFEFAGSDIQFWGVVDYSLIGDVTATFTIDDITLGQPRIEADADSQDQIYRVKTNFELFSADELTNGLHRVLVNVTSCNNQMFSLDYITYTPSFTSGVDAPTGSPSPLTSKKSLQIPIGAIMGIVIGVFLIIIALLVSWQFKRRKKAVAITVTDPFPAPPSTAVIARKEEIPLHMRYLRSLNSQETAHFAGGPSTTRAGTIAPTRAEDTLNINELMSTVPPPAYPTDHTIVASTISDLATRETQNSEFWNKGIRTSISRVLNR